MEEIMSMVVHGCKLAKELESNLAATMEAGSQQPSLMISRSCDDIIKIFSIVKERVDNNGMVEYHHQNQNQMLYPEAAGAGLVPGNIDPSLQEWLRSSVTQAMDHLLFHKIPPFEMEGCSTGTRLRGVTEGGDGHVQGTLMEVSTETSAARGGGGGGSSSSQRHRRSSDSARTLQVPAPRFGNTEIPPDDGYTWRKYGQKEILNSKFPRSYYRCTHQKMYNCPAKKQVQRLDDDPYTFEVTYHDDHICHMSSTAPSAPPSAAVALSPEVTHDQMTQTITMQQPSSTTLGRWLSMELGTGGSGSGSSGGGGGGAGPSSSSAVRYDREGEHPYLNVANMADAMFNSGSSSSNSMEFIFPPMEDKWQHEEKKN
ncbi:hypothetical protein Ddye_032035 [Dipteronia dyeriana]|uniref:WRKY domain-containing protein n=1 Tax=Dipteronia dyeriana TaxID=168575 RepID=A0AAD9TK06_9ROSI|nr:hypothetical protein Ddye_032035 [Dipteronia dyeriana]